MADQKISELTALTGANVADDDAIAIVDTSATETKKIVFSELKTALDTATGFVRITGDTMTGALDVQSTITADGLTVDGDGTFSATNPTVDIKATNGNDASLILMETTGNDFGGNGANGFRSRYDGGDNALYIQSGAETTIRNRIKVDRDTGDISFYEDTGTTPKFYWDASAESLGIGTSSPSALVHASGAAASGGSVEIRLEDTAASSNSRLMRTGSAYSYAGVGANETWLYHAGAGTINIGPDGAGTVKIVNGGSERMRIDSSGNVGIGVTPTERLDIQTTAGRFKVKALGGSSVELESNSAVKLKAAANDVILDGASNIIFDIADAEKMRIDSSGNLLVGKTASSISTVGGQINANGQIRAIASGLDPIFVNRLTSDGDIIKIAKDGTTVGTIGSRAGLVSTFILDPRSGGAGISAGGPVLYPTNESGSLTNGNMDFGAASYRWKDLHLSGSIEIENGTGNVGVGRQALNSNTGSNNTAVGFQAGYTNNTGQYNTFIGKAAGYNATSDFNTYIGHDAGLLMTSGTKNTILGRYNGNQGGLDIRTSSNNIVLSDGDGNPRLYIDSAGDCKIGGGNTSQGYQAVGLTAFANGETTLVRDGGSPLTCTRKTSAGHIIDFYNTTTFSGYINVNGSTTSYATSSDYRLKENVVDLTGATERLKQLAPKRFNFISDADTTVDGFLAHEVQDIVPEAIGGTKDEVDADGNPVYQGIDQSKLVPLLVATIQELEARITALENA